MNQDPLNERVFVWCNFPLASGITLPEARLIYATLGRLNPEKDNVVLIPSWFAGSHADSARLLTGNDRPIDPSGHFIVLTNLLGGGISSSPGNTAAPFSGPDFPQVSIADNVILQARMLEEVFGIRDIRLIAGWSMGAMQGFHWASLFPDRVHALAAFCGASRTANYNKVFLHALRSALQLDPLFKAGRYIQAPRGGLQTFAGIYAGWGLSEPFYRHGTFKTLGFDTVEDFISGFWVPNFEKHDVNNILAQLDTWQQAGIAGPSATEDEHCAALRAITARTVIAPCAYDRYFPPEDSETEARLIPGARLSVIPSEWGHMTIFNKADRIYFDAVLASLLDDAQSLPRQ